MSTDKKAFEDIEEIPCEDTPATEEPEEVDEESEDEDYEDDYEEDDYNPVDFGQLLSNFFVTENGENVAEALMGIKKAIETHNKIFLKYVNKK